MKRIGATSVLSLIIGLVLIFSGGVFNGTASAKTYNLKFQLTWNTQHPEYKAYQKFIKMVKKATNGQIRFTLFPASQLIGTSEALDGLRKGTIDMLASSAVYYHGMVPEGDVDWLPYTSLGHRKPFWTYMNYQKGGKEGQFHDIIYKDYLKKANSIWLTSVLCAGEGIIGRGNHAFKTIDSLKNIKLRAAGGVATRVAKAWGAAPVTMATGEIYPALQRGTVDALLFTVYGLKDYKFFEIAKTYTNPPVFIWSDDLWINKNSFDRLPEKLQKALVKVAHEWGEWASLKYWPAYEKKSMEWSKKKGVKFYRLSDADIAKSKKMMKKVWTWYAHESPDCNKLVELLKEKEKNWK